MLQISSTGPIQLGCCSYLPLAGTAQLSVSLTALGLIYILCHAQMAAAEMVAAAQQPGGACASPATTILGLHTPTHTRAEPQCQYIATVSKNPRARGTTLDKRAGYTNPKGLEDQGPGYRPWLHLSLDKSRKQTYSTGKVYYKLIAHCAAPRAVLTLRWMCRLWLRWQMCRQRQMICLHKCAREKSTRTLAVTLTQLCICVSVCSQCLIEIFL